MNEKFSHISPAEAVNLIRQTNGGFFGVVFIKLDGSLRSMNARLGVRKDVKGTGRVSILPRYITVWDRTKGGYRKINVTTIQSLSANRARYTVA